MRVFDGGKYMTKIFEIGGIVAGLAGISVIAFYYLFREFIKKNIFPKLSRDQAFRLLRLFLILVFAVTVIGITFWSIEKLNSKTPIYISPASLLSMEIQRIEYVSFLLYNPQGTKLPETVPFEYFSIYEGGLVASMPPLESIGLEAASYKEVLPPHVPEGELVMEFSLLNQGPTKLVKKIFLEVIDTIPIPQNSAQGTFLPVLEPIEGSVIISRDKSEYSLFGDKMFSYPDGGVDLFRLNVLISDSELPVIFKFRIGAIYSVGSEVDTIISGEQYISKSMVGMTPRIPYEKRDEGSMSKLRTPNVNDKIGKRKYNTDAVELERRFEQYIDNILQFSNCNSMPDTNYVVFIKGLLWKALMAGERDSLEIFGILQDEAESEFEEIFGAVGGPNTTWVSYGWSHDKEYNTISYPEYVLYNGRNTVMYECLLLVCEEYFKKTKPAESREVTNFMIEIALQDSMDIAAIYDLIPVLAFSRQDTALEFILNILYHDNHFIRERAVEVFAYIKYEKAKDAIMAILKEVSPYVRETALRALMLQGDESTAREIITLFEDGYFHISELELVAKLVAYISPNYALDLSRSYLTMGSYEKSMIARVVLKELK